VVTILVSFNRFGIHMILPYFIVGLGMWFFMLESGVHATIAGVIAAMAIPSKPKYTPLHFTLYTRNRLDAVNSPAARLEHEMHLPISLIVIPLFALANAGISIDFSSIGTTIMQPVSLGIILGLVLGKVLGIAGVAWLAIKLGIAKLPAESTMNQIFGVAFLGGIGFTMSIFVADLAFMGNETLIFEAKVGILCASLSAGLFG
jgi:NhaA family Na+:H+ antiporter